METNTLNPDNILSLEFNYIKETANQAIDDRYKFLNFYIGIATFVATLAIGVGSLGSDGNLQNLQTALAALCLLISFIGWIFLAMFIRLRQAWHESVTAMNQIKQHYVTALPSDDLGAAFVWSGNSIPHRHRTWNIHFFAALLVMIIDTAFLTVSFLVLGAPVWMAAAISALTFVIQILIYRISLYRNL